MNETDEHELNELLSEFISGLYMLSIKDFAGQMGGYEITVKRIGDDTTGPSIMGFH